MFPGRAGFAGINSPSGSVFSSTESVVSCLFLYCFENYTKLNSWAKQVREIDWDIGLRTPSYFDLWNQEWRKKRREIFGEGKGGRYLEKEKEENIWRRKTCVDGDEKGRRKYFAYFAHFAYFTLFCTFCIFYTFLHNLDILYILQILHIVHILRIRIFWTFCIFCIFSTFSIFCIFCIFKDSQSSIHFSTRSFMVPEAWRQCFISSMNSGKIVADGWTDGRDGNRRLYKRSLRTEKKKYFPQWCRCAGI